MYNSCNDLNCARIGKQPKDCGCNNSNVTRPGDPAARSLRLEIVGGPAVKHSSLRCLQNDAMLHITCEDRYSAVAVCGFDVTVKETMCGRCAKTEFKLSKSNVAGEDEESEEDGGVASFILTRSVGMENLNEVCRPLRDLNHLLHTRDPLARSLGFFTLPNISTNSSSHRMDSIDVSIVLLDWYQYIMLYFFMIPYTVYLSHSKLGYITDTHLLVHILPEKLVCMV